MKGLILILTSLISLQYDTVCNTVNRSVYTTERTNPNAFTKDLPIPSIVTSSYNTLTNVDIHNSNGNDVLTTSAYDLQISSSNVILSSLSPSWSSSMLSTSSLEQVEASIALAKQRSDSGTISLSDTDIADMLSSKSRQTSVWPRIQRTAVSQIKYSFYANTRSVLKSTMQGENSSKHSTIFASITTSSSSQLNFLKLSLHIKQMSTTSRKNIMSKTTYVKLESQSSSSLAIHEKKSMMPSNFSTFTSSLVSLQTFLATAKAIRVTTTAFYNIQSTNAKQPSKLLSSGATILSSKVILTASLLSSSTRRVSVTPVQTLQSISPTKTHHFTLFLTRTAILTSNLIDPKASTNIGVPSISTSIFTNMPRFLNLTLLNCSLPYNSSLYENETLYNVTYEKKCFVGPVVITAPWYENPQIYMIGGGVVIALILILVLKLICGYFSKYSEEYQFPRWKIPPRKKGRNAWILRQLDLMPTIKDVQPPSNMKTPT